MEDAKIQVQATEQPEEGQTPRGRAAFLEAYKKYNPDIADEPDDDSLFDFGRIGLTERDELKGNYERINGANERLSAVISEDPRFAQFIAMVANGENLMYALGKTFGNLIDQVNDDQLEELRKGQEEYKSNFTRIKDNFNTYENDLKTYAEENGLDEEAINEINETILDIAEAFMERSISRDIIEIVHKGLDHDADKEAELEAARLAAKNEAIEEIKNKKQPADTMPDLTGQKSNKKTSSPERYANKITNVADAFVERDV
ncbi:hypothetical protein D0T49_03460 [Paludibacter sp. 221]|uniref:hypothetical protein n=1 Tax=Paludibacter sp. 221 TaxID=2302939 RepID=UPI0013D52462|nr:hypothetical protein [Paludibacter sp. 221]NDV46098.1 hypothetical protein [Paludibacter sp. 221]